MKRERMRERKREREREREREHSDTGYNASHLPLSIGIMANVQVK